MGLFNVLLSMNGGSSNVDDGIIALMTKYSEVWDGLDVEESN